MIVEMAKTGNRYDVTDIDGNVLGQVFIPDDADDDNSDCYSDEYIAHWASYNGYSIEEIYVDF